MVGEEAAPQMYDEEVVPHTFEEGQGVRLPLQPPNPTCEVLASSRSDRFLLTATH